MNTNFFNQIQQLDFTGVLQLNISKGIESNLIVTVLLNNEQCGDSAKNLIPPLTFNATPQEFDEGFFEQITTPIQKVSGLMVDMEKFQKQLDEAKAQSAIEKAKTEKEKKEKEVKDKKFKDAMAKADELEKEGKFREAWIKVPDITEFPEKADEIRKRKIALSDKFATPSLFGAMDEAKPEPPIEQEITADYPIDETDEDEKNSNH
ncbi:PRTRC system protein E [Chryseobacterium indologenes]|jgi:PRTRC genetic system protein E|uniref:PRTRC system protein E n=4 Tax=Bacteroidota TaxID=976 RepID=A0A1H5YXV7_9FLAO|nr:MULTISPECIES: PRTRC system protein E [Bacteroidota]MDV3664732.1 prtrc system protein e [Elizabethkingia anophelis]EEI90765.1 PRTRC system protein E [Sphingobacterium spiritivorum ATCC 33300]MBG0514583.1 PRTRC system protein E [Elizabethkingia meningoseptica]MCC9073986.1 PRTRC system protein E [Flavobacterium sp. F-65]QPQ50956.1 PRTRC system protein E [Chryseobacterium indologenes]